MKSKAWRDDRNWLRAALREKPVGVYATFLCVIVSHMRGKMHMSSYKLKSAGWRRVSRRTSASTSMPEERQVALSKMYGDFVKCYYCAAVIEDLEAQAEWLRHYADAFENEYDVRASKWIRRNVIQNEHALEIAGRVLNADMAYAVDEVTTPEVLPATQSA